MTEPEGGRPIAVSERIVRFGPNDREPFPYAVVPFDVPAATRALRLTLDYDGRASSSDAQDRNIVDLGLLGPGPTDVGLSAFRGWSGSERSIVVVGESRATPGYRPGPLAGGTWHVLLGLYRIAPDGCEARLRLECLAEEPAIPGGVAARLPRSGDRADERAPSHDAPLRWIPADLHAHSLHSDGTEPVPALAERACARGLEALFVTDHNTDSHVPELGAPTGSLGLALHPGEEVTTYGGHLNALGTGSWVDFRYVDGAGVGAAIEAIHALGGLASVNHPTSVDLPWLHGSGLAFDCVEVWNGPWSPEDDAALDLWEAILASGRRVTAVGGSDTHGPGPGEQPIGTPTTWLLSSGTDRAGLLEAIRAGRVVLTASPDVPPPLLWLEAGERRAGPGEALRRAEADEIVVGWSHEGTRGDHARGDHARDERALVVVDGAVRLDVPAAGRGRGPWRIRAGEQASRVRLEIRTSARELVAATNPVYLEGPQA